MFEKILQNNIKIKKNKGFTLIELLLYIAISSIILLITSLFLSTLLESRVKNQTISEVEQQGVQVMQIITQTIRNGDIVNSPTAGTSSASLSLNTFTPANNPTVFDLSSGVIQIKEGTSTVIPLTNSKVTASSLSFLNLSRSSTPGVVQVSFTISYLNLSGRNEYSFTKNFIGSASLR